MGQDFKDLSSSDISAIMNSSIDDYADGLDYDTLEKLEYAMEETKNALEGYEPTSSVSAYVVQLRYCFYLLTLRLLQFLQK